MKKFPVLIASILALFLGLTLTGCSGVDSAATVGSTKISLKELQSSVDTILAERGKVDTSQMQLQTGADLTRAQLTFMISTMVIEKVAADQKISITSADVEAYKTQIYVNIGGSKNLPGVLVNAAIPSTSLDSVLRRDLILQKISDAEKAKGSDDATVSAAIQKLVVDKADQLKISVNPRYGTWDSTTFSVVAKEPAGNAVTTK